MQRTAFNKSHRDHNQHLSTNAALGFVKLGSAMMVGFIAAVGVISVFDIGNVPQDAVQTPHDDNRVFLDSAGAGPEEALNGLDFFGRPARYDAKGYRLGWNAYPYLVVGPKDVIACDSMIAFDYLDQDGMEACTIIPAGKTFPNNGPALKVDGSFSLDYQTTTVEVSEMYGPEDGVVDGKMRFFYRYNEADAVLVDDLWVRPAGYTGPHYEDGMR